MQLMEESMQQQKDVPLLFYSYAENEKDESLLKALETHLGSLTRRRVISGWHKGKIEAGMEWAKQIEENLNRAAIILLLISPDFLASDYPAGIEEAMQRHERGEARVIPILLRPADWQDTPFARLQHLPRNRKFVTDWANQDAAFLEITEGIRRVVEDITTPKPSRSQELSGTIQGNTGSLGDPGPPGKLVISPRKLFSSLHITRRNLIAVPITALVTGSVEAAVYYLYTHPANPTPLQVYTGHNQAVQTVAWSPDGKYIASAGKDKSVQVWHADTASSAYEYPKHTATVRRVAWSPDSKYLASAGDDQVVRVWTALSGDDYAVYQQHTDQIHGIAWSPKNGQVIASAGYDKTVHIWNISTKQDLIHPYTAPDRVESIAWSPDGQWIVVAADDGVVHLLDVRDGKQYFPYDWNEGLVTYDVAWSPDSTQLVSASADQTVNIWERAQDKAHTLNEYNNSVWAVAWSPDGEYILSGSKDRTVQVWDARSFNRVFLYKGSDTISFMTSVTWDPQENKRFAVGSTDGTVRIWSL